MDESNTAKSITEVQFKRICGEVWADSLSNSDAPLEAGTIAEEEAIVLGRVLELLRRHLDLDVKAPTPESNSLECRDEIDVLVRKYAAAPFDHKRVLDRLVRELQKAQFA